MVRMKQVARKRLIIPTGENEKEDGGGNEDEEIDDSDAESNEFDENSSDGYKSDNNIEPPFIPTENNLVSQVYDMHGWNWDGLDELHNREPPNWVTFYEQLSGGMAIQYHYERDEMDDDGILFEFINAEEDMVLIKAVITNIHRNMYPLDIYVRTATGRTIMHEVMHHYKYDYGDIQELAEHASK